MLVKLRDDLAAALELVSTTAPIEGAAGALLKVQQWRGGRRSLPSVAPPAFMPGLPNSRSRTL
jgi:hypothetical protein